MEYSSGIEHIGCLECTCAIWLRCSGTFQELVGDTCCREDIQGQTIGVMSEGLFPVEHCGPGDTCRTGNQRGGCLPRSKPCKGPSFCDGSTFDPNRIESVKPTTKQLKSFLLGNGTPKQFVGDLIQQLIIEFKITRIVDSQSIDWSVHLHRNEIKAHQVHHFSALVRYFRSKNENQQSVNIPEHHLPYCITGVKRGPTFALQNRLNTTKLCLPSVSQLIHFDAMLMWI